MASSITLAIILGVGGFGVVVYFTTELAGILFGFEPLPAFLRRIAQMDSGQKSRLMRATPLVVFLIILEGVIVAVLVRGLAAGDLVAQTFLWAEPIAALAWVAWLTTLYRSHSHDAQ